MSEPRIARWISVDLVTDGAEFAALRSEWDELLEDSDASLFNSWEWLYSWYRRMAPNRVLRIMVAREREGRLVGVFPLCLDRRRVWGRWVNRLAFLGEAGVGSDYLDIVARRGFEDDVRKAFAGELKQAASEWDVLDLMEVRSDSATLTCLKETLGDEICVRIAERYTCPFELLDSQPFDFFLRRTGRRDNYLRRRKWLEKQPGYRIEKTADPVTLSAPLAHFFRLHRLRWDADGGSQGIRGPQAEAFHRDVTALFAERGKVRFYTMYVGEQAIASVYGLLHQEKFLYFQSGYDPEWRSKSPGLVLVGETFKDSIETGFTEYDFLHGTEPYKFEWTTQVRKTVTLRAFSRGGRGEWFDRMQRLSKRARELVKQVLPRRALKTLRNMKNRTRLFN